MISLDSKFIFPKIIQALLESSYLLFFSHSIYMNQDTDEVIFDLLCVDFFFYYLEIISSISMLYNYIQLYGTTFPTWYHIKIFQQSFVVYRIKMISCLMVNIVNLLISFFYPFVTPKEPYKENLNICLNYIFITTFFKVIGFLAIGLYSCICPRLNRYKKILLMIQNIRYVSGDVCSICLEENANKKWGELKCKHRFHTDCLVPWIETNRTCPMCRVYVE